MVKLFLLEHHVTIPKNAVVIDLSGKSIYPSFIDMYSTFGVEKPKRSKIIQKTTIRCSREGYYWNDHIRARTKCY